MDDPPPYSESSTSASGPASGATQQASSLHPTKNGIPVQSRRSMEDEHRPLPPGWVRQFDTETQHQFFVDTRSKPHRSIWQHPLDDDQYLQSLDPDERARQARLHRSVSLADIEAESSDDDDHGHHKQHLPTGAGGASAPLPPRGEEQPKGIKKFGRKLKDKVTDSTHQERERQRLERAKQEQQAYERHLAFRQAFAKAMETGQPQLIGKDKNGKDIYIEPPNGPTAPGNAYGYNPYAQGPYGNPNARFIRPEMPYSRPYGYGYGGGYGFPLAGGMMLGGGLLGAGMLGGGMMGGGLF